MQNTDLTKTSGTLQRIVFCLSHIEIDKNLQSLVKHKVKSKDFTNIKNPILLYNVDSNWINLSNNFSDEKKWTSKL